MTGVETGGTPAGDEIGAPDAPLRPRLPWVRARLRVPDLERLLDAPLGSRIDGNFDSLRVRMAKAIERIAEEAGGAREEILRRAARLRAMAMASALAGSLALVLSLARPEYRAVLVLLALAEAVLVTVLRLRQRTLVRDLIAVADLEARFRGPLEAARTPEDLQRLAERIRAEMAAALDTTSPAGEGTAHVP